MLILKLSQKYTKFVIKYYNLFTAGPYNIIETKKKILWVIHNIG